MAKIRKRGIMRRRPRRVIIGAVAVGILLTVFVMARLNQAPAKAVIGASSVTTTITIDPTAGEVFAPPPANAAPALTAEQAYVQYQQLIGDPVTAIPSNVKAQLGLLTLPVGSAGPDTSNLPTQNGIAYTALNELVYGYEWSSCPETAIIPNATASPSANPCVEWNFLDANTGKQVDQTWQMSQ